MAQSTVYADAHAYENLWRSVHSQNFSTFGVKQCKDAMVQLGTTTDPDGNPDAGVEAAYEILIGAAGNAYTGIRTEVMGEYVAFASTPGVLSCNETRYFWVSGNIS
jgi:hypothetical protein